MSLHQPQTTTVISNTSHIISNTSMDPGPLTRAMRPATGLQADQRATVTQTVKFLMRLRLDALPAGASLSEIDKEQVFVSAVPLLSERLGQPVTVDQIRIVAAALRTSSGPRNRRSTNLTPRHHDLLVADAEASGSTIGAIVAEALNAFYS